MDDDNKNKIIEWLIFAYLVLFPFGQLIRWKLSIADYSFPIHPTDFIVGIIFLVTHASRMKYPEVFKYIKAFSEIALFTLLISVFIFKSPSIIIGGLYLLRIYAYTFLMVAVWNVFNSPSMKDKLSKGIIAVCVAVGFFGWIQYLFYPDIRPLFEWGWDDHLFRLVSTYLDPAFTSIILVFGCINVLSKYFETKKLPYLLGTIFFVITIAFTYSRAGYLALVAGIIAILISFKKAKTILIYLLGIVMIVLLLPRPSSEGVKLERLASIYARGTNYIETFHIFEKSPLFGVGFNNLCLARQKYLGQGEFSSHSCSGSDSSVLFVLATTGIVGLIFFVTMLVHTYRHIEMNTYGIIAIASIAALFVHGLFSNSVFYPWVMGYLALSVPIALKEQKSR
jgi:preprotein translocase subunit SecG